MAIRWKGLLSFKSKHWVIPRPIGIELLLSFYFQSRTGRACLLVHVNLWLVPSIQTAVLPTITNCETLPPRPRANGWTSESFTKYMTVVSLVTWQQYGNRVLRISVIFSLILDNISTPGLFTCSRLLQYTFYFNHHKTQGKWQWFIYLNFSSLCDSGSDFLLNEIQYINTSGLWRFVWSPSTCALLTLLAQQPGGSLGNSTCHTYEGHFKISNSSCTEREYQQEALEYKCMTSRPGV